MNHFFNRKKLYTYYIFVTQNPTKYEYEGKRQYLGICFDQNLKKFISIILSL